MLHNYVSTYPTTLSTQSEHKGGLVTVNQKLMDNLQSD